MKLTKVKELKRDAGMSAVLLRSEGGDYFLVSTIPEAFDTGEPETLAFKADEDGQVLDWDDVAGGILQTREQVIAELELVLDGAEHTPHPNRDNPTSYLDTMKQATIREEYRDRTAN